MVPWLLSRLRHLYALLEGEASLAARIVGLYPGLGVLHADLDSRDSLAADLMEPVRPLVDRWALTLLADRSLALNDLYETRQGVCRLTARLAAELAETTTLWRKSVGRVAETVASLLAAEGGRATPTPISGRRRAEGRPQGPRPSPEDGYRTRSCTWCGGPAPAGRRTCSAACHEALVADDLPAFAAQGAERLAQRRALGKRTQLSADGKRRIAARASDMSQRRARGNEPTRGPPMCPSFSARYCPSCLASRRGRSPRRRGYRLAIADASRLAS